MYLYRLWVAKYNSGGSNIIIAKFYPLMEILLIAKKKSISFYSFDPESKFGKN